MLCFSNSSGTDKVIFLFMMRLLPLPWRTHHLFKEIVHNSSQASYIFQSETNSYNITVALALKKRWTLETAALLLIVSASVSAAGIIRMSPDGVQTHTNVFVCISRPSRPGGGVTGRNFLSILQA